MNNKTKIVLIQQTYSENIIDNQQKGQAAVHEAAANGAKIVGFAELAFEPFYPQNPAGKSVLKLAEPVPGPTTEEILYYDIDRDKVKTSHARRLFFPDRRPHLYAGWFSEKD
jgi:predicted amidohydrolase